MKEQGLTQILTYDRKHFARVPGVQIGECDHMTLEGKWSRAEPVKCL